MSTSADFTFNFLLYLFKRGEFTSRDGKVYRDALYRNFDQFCDENIPFSERNQKLEIITLLKENGYILFNNRQDYLVLNPHNFLRDFYSHLEEIDKNHIQEQLENLRLNSAEDTDSVDLFLSNIEDEQTTDSEPSFSEDEIILELYDRINRNKQCSFQPTNFGCFVCLTNYADKNEYDEHIKRHKIPKPEKKRNQIGLLELSYSLSSDSNKIRFKIISYETNIVIERVILVLDDFYYVNLHDLPYHMTEDEEYFFEVDRNGLTLNVAHPLFVLYSKPYSSYESIEEHHFMRTEPYPPSRIQLRSIKVPDRDELAVVKHSNVKINPSLKRILCLNNPDKLIEYLSVSYYSFKKYYETKKITPSTFIDVYNSLVQIEDIEAEREYEQLNQKGVPVRGEDGEFRVKLQVTVNTSVADLIAPFDNIFLIDNSLPNPHEFRGSVHKVFQNEVLFTVSCGSEKFRLMSGPDFDVRFVPNRYQMLCQYSALSKTDTHLLRYLFPNKEDIKKKEFQKSLTLYNKSIEGNPEQLQAVEQIVCGGWTNACPYVLFGPPGTGKTTTIVECIIQLLNKNPNNRILVTAQSNSACDEITKRLKSILYSGFNQKPTILRIYSQTYRDSIERVDDEFYEVSNVCHSTHLYPTVEVLKTYRVVIATPFVVGMYNNSGLHKGAFSHIFFDENASVSIPEALCSISGIWFRNTKLILSGDPKQLGHIFKYKACEKLGFHVSLMERLLELPVYRVDENGDYNIGVQTRLRKNFRCHPEILKMFNHMCYNGELEAHGDAAKVNRAVGWHGLPNKKVPIVFCPVTSHSQRSLYETSWWNPDEIEVVLGYVINLMFHGLNGTKVSQSDIGIISPYKKQYNVIKSELEKRNWGEIEIGSAEIFQGREKQIIIVSTVRSGTPTVGFLNNLKRLNVMMSRAEALLIVIGNPSTLSKDKNWEQFIDMMRRADTFSNNKRLRSRK